MSNGLTAAANVVLQAGAGGIGAVELLAAAAPLIVVAALLVGLLAMLFVFVLFTGVF